MSSFYDLASLVMIPSGKKAGKVYSQKPLTTDGQLDFTRASTATRIGSDGNIEKTRTNSLLNTETFSSWNLEGGALTGGFSAPDGTLTASKYVPSGSSGLFSTAIFTDSLIKTISIYVKSVDGTSFSVTLGNGVNVGVITKTVTPTWQRISVSPTTTTSAMSLYLYAIGNVNGLFVWHPQGEYGTVATDYIATTSAAVSVGSVDNMPRLNYTPGSATSCPSLLLEPQRTNVLIHSEYFNSYTQFGSDITQNSLTSPEGVTNASTFIGDGSQNQIYLSTAITLSSGGNFTASIFAKTGTNNFLELGFEGFSTSTLSVGVFNLTSGTATGTGTSMESYGNGWYRCILTQNIDSGDLAGAISMRVRPESSLFWPSASDANGKSVYLYAAQVELGSYATSYIPTFGATVTRVADECEKTGISGLIGQTEGTLFADFEIDANNTNGFNRVMAIGDGTSNNRILILAQNTEKFRFFVSTAGVIQVDEITTVSVLGGQHKVAFAYKANDFVAYVDGVQIASDTSGTVPVCDDVFLGTHESGSLATYLEGGIKNALLFKTRLSNTQLADLTSIDS